MSNVLNFFGAGNKIIPLGKLHAVDLGPLEGLAGTWKGTSPNGWNVITVPDDSPDGFIFEVMPYSETLTFSPIVVASNRGTFGGSRENIQSIAGLLYEQIITSECNTSFCAQRGFSAGTEIHAERGIFLYLRDNEIRVKPVGFPPHDPRFSIARLSTIPHGNSVLALGNSAIGAQSVPLPSSTPYPQNLDGTPANINLTQFNTQQFSSLGFDQTHPNSFLPDSVPIKGSLVSVVNLNFDTKNLDGGILNIPFVNSNVKPSNMNSNFYLQSFKIEGPGNDIINQLQYTQTINLVFLVKGQPAPLIFPHITLNTLNKV